MQCEKEKGAEKEIQEDKPDRARGLRGSWRLEVWLDPECNQSIIKIRVGLVASLGENCWNQVFSIEDDKSLAKVRVDIRFLFG